MVRIDHRVWTKVFSGFVAIACTSALAASQSRDDLNLEASDDLYLSDAKVDESKALAHYAWGLLLLLRDQQRTEDVQEQLVEALRNMPHSRYLLEQAASPWLIRDNYAAIVEKLGPIAKDHPEAVHLQLLVSAAYQKIDDNDAALALIESAFYEHEVRDSALLRELARLYWVAKKHRKLERLLNDARKDESLQRDFVSYYALAIFHGSMASNPEEIELSDKQIQRHERRALEFARQAAGQLSSAENATDISNLAGVFESHDQNEEAVRLLRKARSMYPRLAPVFDIRIAKNLQILERTDEASELLYSINISEISSPQLLIDLGRAFLEQDELQGAVKCYERVLGMVPKAAGVRLTLGYLYLRNGSPRETINLFALQEDISPDALVLVSRAYASMDDYAKAEEWLDRAAETAGTLGEKKFFDIDYYLYRATIQEETGRTDEAIESARKALAKEPDNPVAANFVGYVLADHNRELKEAESLIKLAVSQAPENAAYLDSLAWVYYRQKRYREALREITKALRQPDLPDDPIVLDHAGDIYAANGYPRMASRYWWEALRASPENAEEIKSKLK